MTATDSSITVYGASWCPDCKRARKFLGEQLVPYTWFDLGEHPQAQEIVERYNNGKQIIPTIVFADGSVLIEPSNAALAAKLGLQTTAQCASYDVIVVGAGPTGLTAAIYSAREGLDVLAIDRAGLGGQAAITERVDNYPAFPEGISGAAFADRIVRQARRFGVEILAAQEVEAIERANNRLAVRTADGTRYGADAVLVATGSTYRRLDVPGEEDFIGAGVHFCATCDGAFYREKDVLVVGGGNSAGEESIFLTKFAKRVTIATRDEQLSASKVVVEKVNEHPKIEIITNTTPAEFRGDGKLETVVLRNTVTGYLTEVRPNGVFVF